jgi:hypothetical protein
MPALVTIHVWRVPKVAVPQALFRLARDRRAVHALRFGKLLGTGSGETFATRDVDATRWALLACWDSTAQAEAFERNRVVQKWDDLAVERARVELQPLRSRGSWSGREPFATPDPPDTWRGAVAAITRARIRPAKIATFWRAVPPVSLAMRNGSEALFRMGIGEAPIGWQGTFSLWPSAAALHRFAYDDPAHTAVIRRTPTENWYAEELFARFGVLKIDGTLDGRAPLTSGP